MKAYIIGGDKNLVNFLPDIEITDVLGEANIVIFGDGPAVSPSLYKEKKNPSVELISDIKRDRSDKSIYTKMRPDQIAVGISRGACFLAVMNGASLVQYAYKMDPESSYDVELKVKGVSYKFPAIGDWVQSINLEKCEDYKLAAVSHQVSDYIADSDVKRFMRTNGDPEIVMFSKKNKPKSLCIQFHPEWMPKSQLSKILRGIIYGRIN